MSDSKPVGEIANNPVYAGRKMSSTASPRRQSSATGTASKRAQSVSTTAKSSTRPPPTNDDSAGRKRGLSSAARIRGASVQNLAPAGTPVEAIQTRAFPVENLSSGMKTWVQEQRTKAKKAPEKVGELNILVSTWNVGNKKPNGDFTPWIPPKGGKYDLIAVCLQESSFSSKQSDQSEDTATAAANEDSDEECDEEEVRKSTVDDGNKSDNKPEADTARDQTGKHSEVSKAEYSTPGDVRKTPIFKMLCEHLKAESENDGVVKGNPDDWIVVSGGMLGKETAVVMEIGLIIFARRKHMKAINKVEKAGEATGIMRVVANKGGMGVGFSLYGTSVCFIGAHLNAHMQHLEKRNSDVREIHEGIKLRETALTLDRQFAHVFFAGDLNYRLDRNLVSQERNEELCRQYGVQIPNKSDKKSVYRSHWELTKALIDDKKWKELMEADQLKHCIKCEKVFHGYKEGEYKFPPTFKVARDQGYDYTSKRIPSYCDRVLWRSLPSLSGNVKLEELASYSSITSSDHKPVSAGFQLSLTAPVQLGPGNSGPILRFSHINGHKLIPMDPTGYSDPYISFYSDPPGLLASRNAQVVTKQNPNAFLEDNATTAAKQQKLVGDFDALAAYIETARQRHMFMSGGRAPRTKVMWSTLNPKWEGSDKLPLLRFNVVNPLELSRCHLFLQINDYDATSKDDDMGAAVLPLDKIAYGDKYCSFDVPVVCNSQAAGTLEGVFELIWPQDPRYAGLEEGKINQGCGCSIQ